mgnify:CR=1 FL=1
MLKRLAVILIAVMSLAVVGAQELEWSVDMNAVFKNSEVERSETPGETNIFTRITPLIGVSMDSTRHRIMGGVTWYQPMNDRMHGYKVVPALYYQYKNSEKGLNFKIGMIPNERPSMPIYLCSDSINRMSPNVNGLSIALFKPHFLVSAMLDWRQIMTNKRREAFMVIADIGWRNLHTTNVGDNYIVVASTIAYNHLARSGARPEGEGVVDNFITYPRVMYSHWWRNASIAVEAGLLLSCDRDRVAENKWLTQAGFFGGVIGNWKWLTVAQNIYAGKQQMPLYEKYGSLLYQGQNFFRDKFYSRTMVAATFFKTDYLNIQAQLSFHATDKTSAFWQQIAVRFYLDRSLWGKYKKKERHDYYSPLPPQF